MTSIIVQANYEINDPPQIATEIISSPTVSESVIEKHIKSHQESQ